MNTRIARDRTVEMLVIRDGITQWVPVRSWHHDDSDPYRRGTPLPYPELRRGERIEHRMSGPDLITTDEAA